LIRILIQRSATWLPATGGVAVNGRHRRALQDALTAINEASSAPDPLIVAEALCAARRRLDAITGRSGVEDMLDALFARFCIGK
jgi:tRNA modification GTPase